MVVPRECNEGVWRIEKTEGKKEGGNETKLCGGRQIDGWKTRERKTIMMKKCGEGKEIFELTKFHRLMKVYKFELNIQ